MSLEESERSRIDNLKSEEKKAAEEEVFATFAKMEKSAEDTKLLTSKFTVPENRPTHEVVRDAKVSRTDFSKYGNFSEVADESDDYAPVDESDDSVEEGKMSVIQCKDVNISEAADEELRYVPPPRASVGAAGGKVDINFTPRIFSTPVRESKLAEEEDWIAKNRRHLKKHAVYGKNLGILTN